jgi:hypothetical protein
VPIYFDIQSQKRQTGAHIARYLLQQLLPALDEVPAQLESQFKDGKTLPDISTCKELLKFVASKLSIYAVFDAFDECTESEDGVLDLLIHLNNSAYKILISSRPPLNVLQNGLGNFSTLEIRANIDDLIAYVNMRLDVNSEVKRNCRRVMKRVNGT